MHSNMLVEKPSSSKVSSDPNITPLSTPKVSPDPNVTQILTPETSKVSPDPNITHTLIPEANDSLLPKTSINSAATSKSNAHVDVEASVMARFQILKCRGNNSNIINVEEQELPDVDDAVFSGKGNDWPIIRDEIENKSFDVAVGPRFKNRAGNGGVVDEFGSYVDDEPEEDESEKEFHVFVTDDPVVQPCRNNGPPHSQLSSGWYYNSALDWEHVLKDDFALHK